MDVFSFQVDADIRRAFTPPARLYTDPTIYAAVQERLFAHTWHFVGDVGKVKVPGQVCPFTLLKGCLNEPLLLTRDREDRLHCLSNVCTHRGNLVVEQAGYEPHLRCRYHGRRFGLDGTFQQMPEFEGVADFPSERDHLPKVPFQRWGPLLFAALAPTMPFEELLAPLQPRVGWLLHENLVYAPTRSRDHLVQANWALYVENYLDALHIPYVHHELAGALEYESYRTENHRYGNLQIGYTRGGEDTFDLPADSPDAGKQVTAYYVWLFPTTMLNFYPWGLSVNVVQPLGTELTRVSFLRYVADSSKSGSHVSSDAAVDRVEREDEAVVESVQKGVRSRFYDRGRYSPTREQGTHHFHRLLAEFLG